MPPLQNAAAIRRRAGACAHGRGVRIPVRRPCDRHYADLRTHADDILFRRRADPGGAAGCFPFLDPVVRKYAAEKEQGS